MLLYFLVILSLSLAQCQTYTTLHRTLSLTRNDARMASVAGKLFVAGGNPLSVGGEIIDIYDIATNTFVGTHSFAQPRTEIVALSFATKVLFIDQITGEMEQYDSTTATWSLLSTVLPAPVGAAGAVNNKAVIITGTNGGSGYTYNVDNGQLLPWTLCINLACGIMRGTGIGVGTVGDQVIFAGGGPALTDRTLVYDDALGSFTTSQPLSSPRAFLKSATVGQKVVFSSGFFDVFRGANLDNADDDSNVDIYDSVTKTWTSTVLPTNRTEFAFITAGDKVIFAGGMGQPGIAWKTTIDVYDPVTNTWTPGVDSLPIGRGLMGAVTLGGNAVFVGGTSSAFDWGSSSELTIVDSTGAIVANMNTVGFHTLFGYYAVGNAAYFAGGEQRGYKIDDFDVLLYSPVPPVPFSIASSFNVVARQAFTASQSDVQGKLAAGGNITVTDFSIGCLILPPHNPGSSCIGTNEYTCSSFTGSADAVISGNSVHALRTQIRLGNLVYANFYNGGATIAGGGCSARQEASFDFAFAFTKLKAISTSLRGLPATGTFTSLYRQIVLLPSAKRSASNLEVYNIPGSLLATAVSFEIRGVPTGTTIVINVDGANLSLGGFGFLGTIQSSHLVWNFDEATLLTFYNVGWKGSVLAPDANVVNPTGVLEGQIFVNSWNGGSPTMQVNYVPFRGEFPFSE